jgi:hypothetical protein
VHGRLTRWQILNCFYHIAGEATTSDLEHEAYLHFILPFVSEAVSKGGTHWPGAGNKDDKCYAA